MKRCWLARESKKGWTLSFYVGSKQLRLYTDRNPGFYFKTKDDVRNALREAGIVFMDKRK